MADINLTKPLAFCTDQTDYFIIETKSGKDYYISGYISVPEVDVVNDLVTTKAFHSMLSQLQDRDIMIDIDHEVWRKKTEGFENQPSPLIPVGKIVQGKIDTKGLWVKVKLNKSSPVFKNVWGSIKEGFLNAFSIAFKALKTTSKSLKEGTVRIIDDLILLNVALTGNPVNPGAVITGHDMKSIMLKALSEIDNKELEDDKMSEEKEESPVEETVEEKKEEEKKEEPQEEKKEEPVAEKQEAPNVEEKSEQYDKILEELKSIREKQEAQEKELKSLKEKPIFKSKAEGQPEVEEKSDNMENVSMMGLIR